MRINVSLTLLMAACVLAATAAGAARAEYTRSSAEVARFKRAHPCTRYLSAAECLSARVDHPWSLCAGGPDTRQNMAYQPLRESRAKDREERRLCAAIRAGRLPKPRTVRELCALLQPAERWPWMHRFNCGAGPYSHRMPSPA